MGHKYWYSYLSNYPYQFTNVSIRPVALLLVISKQYAVDEVDSHNKPIQSYLALEKWWFTKCVWLRLCTTVSMGMTITNCWELFHYGVKREKASEAAMEVGANLIGMVKTNNKGLCKETI